jgi:hypothetical protein
MERRISRRIRDRRMKERKSMRKKGEIRRRGGRRKIAREGGSTVSRRRMREKRKCWR